ncbi:MAG: BTAD domain-containing putative transcriptional regulator [Pseudonocardiaceae bacterium]
MTAFRTRHPAPGHRHGSGGRRLVVGTARVLGRLVQGLAAVAALVALVAALPWALWHYIGWPLTDHLPTADEMQAVLLGPLSTPLLLDVLECLCWITWVAFVIDVARCVGAAVRGLRWPELQLGGPVHAVAAILVGVIVVSLLGNRSPSAAAAGITEISGGHGGLVATAPAANPAPPHARPIAMVHTTTATAAVAAPRPDVTALQGGGTVVVRAAHNGIHDTLSRIAARTLSDARRWPEIYEANKGKPQPNGGTLTNPNLIFPGERLTLPTSSLPAPATGGDHQVAPPTVPAPPPPRSALMPPPSSTPTSPTHSARQFPPATALRATSVPSAAPEPETGTIPGSGPGIGWEPGVFVGLGLAAAISAAVMMARRRYRGSYRPGSGRRDDLPVAPVVYQLRLVHLRAEHADTHPDSDLDDAERGRWAAPPVLVIGDAHDPDTAPDGEGEVRAAPGLGVRDGREIALDLAVARGLGLAGAGACGAARALLLAILVPTHPPTQPSAGARVIVPVEDLSLVLGPEHVRGQRPAALRVVADLDAALDELEAQTLARARQHDPAAAAWPVMALVARPPAENTQRLQAVLDNGAHLGLVGVLLGQWRPGVSAYIRADGTVSATSPGPGQALLGTRMFRMPEAETADLLALLHHAQPDTPDPTPTAHDHPTPPLVQARRTGGSPPPAGNAPTTLDARDGDVIDDSTLEVAGIPRAQPEGIGPRLVPDLAPHREPGPAPLHTSPDGRQPHHGPDGEPTEQSRTAPRRPPAAPGDTSGQRDTLATPITLSVMGRPRVHWTPGPAGETTEGGAAAEATVRDITAAFPPRQRELLVFLALHPDGVHRDPLVAALWETNPPERPTNALNTALSRLRRALSQATGGAIGDIITIGEGRYQLDTSLVEVDYWRFSNAVTARRAAANDSERITAYERIVDRYGGCLAEGMDTEWIDAAREATRRDAIDAVAALARALVDSDPQHTLDLLETARAFDPHNELLYRDIMRLQERLGHLDAIPRTLTLLTTRLAEIDETPTPQALGLATRLQQRHDAVGADTRTPGRHDPRGDRRDTAVVS